MTSSPLRLLLAAAALAALAACQPKAAAPADTSPPVATVNGVPISHDFYEFYIKGITGKTSAELTPEQRNRALENLIHAELVAQEAAREGLDKSGDTQYLLELSRLNVLQQAVSEHYLKGQQPTEAELRSEYDNQVAAMSKQEYRVRHILVATEPFAEKLIDRLQKGEKFDDLAKAESMDPSKSSGGDLGWVSPSSVPAPFAGAMEALKPGEYTRKPVQTQYGWHIIQLVDTRPVSPPPFDQVKPRLVQVVESKKFKAYVDDLMRNAKITNTLAPAATGSAGNAGAGAAGSNGASSTGGAAPAGGAAPKN